MAWTNFGWADIPAELQPQTGETVADWQARIAAYNTAHPGELKFLEDVTLEQFGEHIYNRAILDAPGSGGVPDSSTTVKGAAKLATAPASAANPIAVGDNDPRMTNARTPTAHTHPVADLGSGSPAAGKYLDGAGAWTTLPASSASFAGLTDVDPSTGLVDGNDLYYDAVGGLVKGHAPRIVANVVGNLGTTKTLDLASRLVSIFTCTADQASCDLTLANAPAGGEWRIEITNPSGSSRTVNVLPSSPTVSVTVPATSTVTVVGSSPNGSLYQHRQVGAGGGGASGSAGGVLSGTYPNPGFAVDMATQAELDAVSATVTANAGGIGSPNTQTTDYTLVIGDAGKMVEVNAGTAKTLTVPPNSSVAFPVGALVRVRQMGVGQVTVAAGAGVTVRSRGSALKMGGQYAEATLIKRATDEWVLSGDVTP